MPIEINLSPVNSEIADLLERHVTGPYRVVNYSWSPYVLVAPASDQPITVRSSAEVHVNGGTRTLHSQIDVLKFVIMNEGGGMQLKDVGFKTGTRHVKASAPVFVVCNHGPVAEGQAPGAPRPKHAPKPMMLVTVPEPETPTAPQLRSAPGPAWAEKIRAREQIQDDLGDYLVIPETRAKKSQLPPWIVPSAHVTAMHVVKPRLGEDREI